MSRSPRGRPSACRSRVCSSTRSRRFATGRERTALLDLSASRRRRVPCPLSLLRAGPTCVSPPARSTRSSAARPGSRSGTRSRRRDRAAGGSAHVLVWGDRGAQRSTGGIDVPTWERDRRQLPATVAAQLAAAHGARVRARQTSGRLILWHGEPGTGKTYALRALAWEWRDWCTCHYITDPETFFGDEPDVHARRAARTTTTTSERWRLLDPRGHRGAARRRCEGATGQGLSRLLNVVDGLIGQGLRVLVLVTTNEALRRLHPAVARPGRCASRIEFVPFTRRGGRRTGSSDTAATRRGRRRHARVACTASRAGVELPHRRRVGFVW